MNPFLAFRVLILAFLLSVTVVLFTGIVFLGDGPSSEEQPKKLFKTVVFPQGGSHDAFNQPWSLPAPVLLDEDGRHEGRLLFSNFSYSRGMGNLMFQVASLASLAKENNASLVLPFSLLLRRSFTLPGVLFSSDEFVDKNLKETEIVEIKNCCRYEKIHPKFNEKGRASVVGYLQSHGFFHPLRSKETKELFRFHEAVQRLAADFLQSAFLERSLRVNGAQMREDGIPGVDEDIELAVDPLDSDVFVVGVHVRHGMDIRWNERNRRHGHVDAPVDYFKKAMKKAIEGQDDYLYVICSDDMGWARKTFKEKEYGPIAFCPGRWREVDMVILTRADVLVLSTGTFSWWAGYLSERAQNVFYYGGWPRPGSILEKMVDKEKYFLSSWTALT